MNPADRSNLRRVLLAYEAGAPLADILHYAAIAKIETDSAAGLFLVSWPEMPEPVPVETERIAFLEGIIDGALGLPLPSPAN